MMHAGRMTMESKRTFNDMSRQVLGFLIAAACLIWVFHGIHAPTLLSQLKGIRWGWVAVAVAFDVTSYLCQGLRWKLLLRPTGTISTMRATQAIYAGLFTNEIVPFRAGELVRAYLVSRWEGTKLLTIVPSMAVERLFDGIWLGIGIGLTAVFVQLPKDLLRAADVFGAIVLAATVAFIVLVARRERSLEIRQNARRGLWKPLRIFVDLLDRVAEGIRNIGTSRAFYLSLLVSSFILICQIFSFWFVMEAYGLNLSLWIGAAVFLVVHFGTALPNAPSNVGTYQFFTVLGLTMFGIDKTTATGFSLAVFVILTLPLWIIGMNAIALTGMRLKDIRSEITKIVGGTG
jgi:uncharacterized protein (TIRG00374 family)